LLGISAQDQRWAWLLAARAAWELSDAGASAELLELLDRYRPGELAPMLRAERDLARARLATLDADQDGAGQDGAGQDTIGAAFAAAVTGLRQQSTPYHLAHGLLDHAAWLAGRGGDPDRAAAVAAEAAAIAARLRCQPLLDRAAALAPADTPLPG
jgi:hypothetical protein